MQTLRIMALLLISTPAFAGVMTVNSPGITKGEATIEYGAGWEKTGSVNAYEHALELSYSPLSWWDALVEFSGTRSGAEGLRHTSTEVKSSFAFLKQDEQTPLSAALRIDYEIAHPEDEADELKMRFLLQHKVGAFDALGNIGFKKEVGEHASGGANGDLRARLRYTVNEWFSPSIEYLGDTGALSDMPAYRDQEHKLGPVAYISIDDVTLQIGYFAGISAAAPDHSAKLNVEVAF